MHPKTELAIREGADLHVYRVPVPGNTFCAVLRVGGMNKIVQENDTVQSALMALEAQLIEESLDLLPRHVSKSR